MKKLRTLILLGLSCTVALAADPPPALSVNGIVTIFGDRRVVFKIFPAGSGETAAILAEGETFDGIRLLSVDVLAGIAHFNNHGLFQNVPLCDASDLVSATAPTAGSVANGRPAVFQTSSVTSPSGYEPGNRTDLNPTGPGFMGGVANGRPPAGQTTATTRAGNEAGLNPNPVAAVSIGDSNGLNRSANASPSTDQSQNAGSGASDSNPDANTWWYRASQSTEAARMATADAVLRGEAPPYPLTPLTPPGTDPRLVSSDAVYFNHFQRYF